VEDNVSCIGLGASPSTSIGSQDACDIKHIASDRLPLLSARSTVTFPSPLLDTHQSVLLSNHYSVTQSCLIKLSPRPKNSATNIALQH